MAADALAAFFSYSRDDLEFALRLARDLKKAGANVWMDKLDIRPGQLWERKAEEALDNCARLLVILSPASVSSRNVMAEVAFALDEQKEVIPVLYRECKVPFRLRPFQYVDFRTDYSQGLRNCSQRVAVDQPQPSYSCTSREVPAADDVQDVRDSACRRRGKLERERRMVPRDDSGLDDEQHSKTARSWRLGAELRHPHRPLRSVLGRWR